MTAQWRTYCIKRSTTSKPKRRNMLRRRTSKRPPDCERHCRHTHTDETHNLTSTPTKAKWLKARAKEVMKIPIRRQYWNRSVLTIGHKEIALWEKSVRSIILDNSLDDMQYVEIGALWNPRPNKPSERTLQVTIVSMPMTTRTGMRKIVASRVHKFPFNAS